MGPGEPIFDLVVVFCSFFPAEVIWVLVLLNLKQSSRAPVSLGKPRLRLCGKERLKEEGFGGLYLDLEWKGTSEDI